MIREDIIAMAQECQLIGMRPHLDGVYESSLERFAALVAAKEREACLDIVESAPITWSGSVYDALDQLRRAIVAGINDRSEL